MGARQAVQVRQSYAWNSLDSMRGSHPGQTLSIATEQGVGSSRPSRKQRRRREKLATAGSDGRIISAAVTCTSLCSGQQYIHLHGSAGLAYQEASRGDNVFTKRERSRKYESNEPRPTQISDAKQHRIHQRKPDITKVYGRWTRCGGRGWPQARSKGMRLLIGRAVVSSPLLTSSHGLRDL